MARDLGRPSEVVADDDGCNGHEIVGNAERLFTLNSLKPSLRETDPARSQSQAPGRKHQIFSRRSCIFDCLCSGPRRDENEGWSVVEDMKVRIVEILVKASRKRSALNRFQHMVFG